jgi:putative transposase
MARPLRIEFPGAVYHVTSRGNERRNIVRDDRDREMFVILLARVVARFGLRLFAWTLMSNHYHLFLRTPEPNLSRAMHMLNQLYAEYFNWRHRRVGHLFQGRFKAFLVDSEEYFREVARYVVLNPVRAGMRKTPGGYKWSSYRATAGLEEAPEWLAVDELLDARSAWGHIEGAAARRMAPVFRPGPCRRWLESPTSAARRSAFASTHSLAPRAGRRRLDRELRERVSRCESRFHRRRSPSTRRRRTPFLPSP